MFHLQEAINESLTFPDDDVPFKFQLYLSEGLLTKQKADKTGWPGCVGWSLEGISVLM